jgi:ribose 5-phosphate isomerase A
MASTGASGGDPRQPLSDDSATDPRAQEKQAAAQAAAELLSDGMRVGLGTGSTVAHLLPAIAARGLSGLRCAATSPRTERVALELGLDVEELDALGELDIAIDGADQIDPVGWLIKGGGGAHTRERIVAAAAREFVVIVSSDKVVQQLSPPVPFGVAHTLAAVAPARLRDGEQSPDGGLLADHLGAIGDPCELAARLSGQPGVVDHGLFAPQMVSLVLVGASGGEVRRIEGAAGRR